MAWAADGTASGFEYDLLTRYVALRDDLDMTLEKSTSFDVLLADVEAGTCDVGAGAVTITEARRERFDFSTPYFPVRAVVVEPSGGHRFKDRATQGVTVAVVRGTHHADLVTDLAQATALVVDSDEALFRAVDEGKADALVCDSSLVFSYLADLPTLEVTNALSERSDLGFIFPKGSPHAAAFSAYLDDLRAGDDYRALLERHFDPGLVAGLFSDEME